MKNDFSALDHDGGEHLLTQTSEDVVSIASLTCIWIVAKMKIIIIIIIKNIIFI